MLKIIIATAALAAFTPAAHATASPVAAWVAATDAKLARSMVAPRDRSAKGTVQIGFVRGDDGRARDLVILTSSGSNAVDRAALRTLRRAELPPLPSGVVATTRLRTVLMYAPADMAPRAYSAAVAEMRAAANAANARLAAKLGDGARFAER